MLEENNKLFQKYQSHYLTRFRKVSSRESYKHKKILPSFNFDTKRVSLQSGNCLNFVC